MGLEAQIMKLRHIECWNQMLTLPDSESLSIEEIAVQVSDFWLDEMKDDKLLVDNLQVSISEVPALDMNPVNFLD